MSLEEQSLTGDKETKDAINIYFDKKAQEAAIGAMSTPFQEYTKVLDLAKAGDPRAVNFRDTVEKEVRDGVLKTNPKAKKLY